jgi:hypothetical protein
VLVLLTLMACGGASDVAVTEASPLDGTWLATVLKEPARFQAVVDADRVGWIALHKNDWTAATSGSGAPAKRAAAELAVFHAVLAQTSGEAWRALANTWEGRGSFPTDSVLPRLVALAAKDAGDATAATRWERVPGRADPALDARIALHARVRKGEAERGALLEVATTPLVEEPNGSAKRPLWDPMLHLSLSQSYGRTIASGYPTDSLDRGLFSGMVDPEDGSPARSLAKLGLTMPSTDDFDACRDTSRAFTDRLSTWYLAFDAASGTDDSRALERDLRLVDGFRSRALVDWAVDALASGRPRCALALAELALDHEQPRAVTPLNSPTLFAVIAQANLRSGRTREALDALEVLVLPFPETTGLDETMGDLAVLEGLDRAGDSREN